MAWARPVTFADLGNDVFCLPGAAAVVNQYLAPSLARARAVARPMPLEAPVTRAVFPESLVSCSSPDWFGECCTTVEEYNRVV